MEDEEEPSATETGIIDTVVATDSLLLVEYASGLANAFTIFAHYALMWNQLHPNPAVDTAIQSCAAYLQEGRKELFDYETDNVNMTVFGNQPLNQAEHYMACRLPFQYPPAGRLVTSLQCSMYFSTNQTSTNYYVIACQTINAAGATNYKTVLTNNTGGLPAGVWHPITLLENINIESEEVILQVQLVPVGNPGNLYLLGNVSMRTYL